MRCQKWNTVRDPKRCPGERIKESSSIFKDQTCILIAWSEFEYDLKGCLNCYGCAFNEVPDYCRVICVGGISLRRGTTAWRRGRLSLSLQSTMRIIADEVNRGYIGSE